MNNTIIKFKYLGNKNMAIQVKVLATQFCPPEFYQQNLHTGGWIVRPYSKELSSDSHIHTHTPPTQTLYTSLPLFLWLSNTTTIIIT